MFIILSSTLLGAENLGKAFYSTCEKCGKQTWKDLYKGRKWFTLTYIPLIPWRKTYRLRCKYCGQDFCIKQGGLKTILELHGLTQKMLRNELTEEEYVALTGSELMPNRLF